MISSSRLAATPRQLGSSAPRKAKSVSTAKELRSSVMMTKGCRAFLIAGSGSCDSPKQRRGHEKHARAQEETSPGPPADARPLGHRSCDGAPPRPRPTRGHEGLTQKARKFSTRNICPNLYSRSETQRTEKKLSEHAPTQRKARAREEPSPGPPASKTDARPPGHQPRGGAPARPRFSRGQEGST